MWLGAECVQHLLGGCLIIKCQRSGGICAEGVGEGGEFPKGTRAIVLPFVDAETERGQQNRERAGGEDQESEIGADGEVPDVHRFTSSDLSRRRGSPWWRASVVES